MYSDFMQEYIDLGQMQPVDSFDSNQPHYVIPHHAVLRPDSSTTKLRVVFDASAKSSSGVSLNNILMVGPTVQQDLILTLLSFRLYRQNVSAIHCRSTGPQVSVDLVEAQYF